MNYNSLMNKPTINYRELIGDNSVTEVGGITEEQFNTLLNTDLSSYYTKAQIDELFARSYVYREKSGSIVTFDCPASVNGIDKVVSEIVAVQSGSGDPSPQNVRPIIGVSAVGLHDTGVNLIDAMAAFKYIRDNAYSSSTIQIDETNKTATCNFNDSSKYIGLIQNVTKNNPTYFPFESGKQYTFIFKVTDDGSSSNWLNIGLSYMDGTNNGGFLKTQRDADGYVVFTSPSNKDVKSLYVGNYNARTDVFYIDTFAVMEGVKTRADFEAFNGTTYTTTLKDGQGNPLTCYGGELSNENGVQTLINKKLKKYLADLSLTKYGTYDAGIRLITSYFDSINNDQLMRSMSNTFQFARGSNWPTSGNWIVFGSGGSKTSILIDSSSGLTTDSTITEIKAWLTSIDAYMVYERSTPEEIPQDNLAIATQEGTNNIWCDTGDITVKALDNIIQG